MRSALIGIVLTGCVAPCLCAQTTGQETTAKERANHNVAAVANVGFAGVGEEEERFQVQAEAGQKDKTGFASVEWRKGQQNYRIRLSGPLDSSGDAVPLTLDGLGSGAKAEFSMARLAWRGPNLREQAEMKRLCLERLGTRECDAEALPPADQELFRELNHEHDSLWYASGAFSAGQDQFKYLQSESLAAASEGHGSWSLAARVGMFTQAFGFVIGSYTRAESYQAGASRQLCRPFREGGTLECRQSVVGAPTKSTANVATLEIRKFTKSIAINPSVQRDFVEKVTAVIVPVYFLKSGDGLSGGIRGSWRSDTRAVTVSIFVGGAVSLLPH